MSGVKPFLTKVWVGRHWWYLDTNHRFSYHEHRVARRWIGVVSYRKVEDGYPQKAAKIHSLEVSDPQE